MTQAVYRRFAHLKNGDSGFSEAPQLLLIDGGITHAAAAERALGELGISVPVFGMVRMIVIGRGRSLRVQAVRYA